jgi:LacI family transcriptional regulator
MVMPISQATIERIHEAARELNYRPNSLARALATGRNQVLGLYSVVMTHPQFTQMLEAVERRARELGYLLIVSSDLKELSNRSRVDGLLAMGLPTDLDFIPLSEMPEEDALKVVYVNRSTEVLPRTISWDDAEGVGQAVRYLVELGHRKIALLCGYSHELESVDPKVPGFWSALRLAEQEGNAVEGRIFWSEQRPNWRNMNAQFDNGYDTTREMIAQWPELTAVVADNDYVAAGAIRALREAGLSVPEDVSIVGYTDSGMAYCTTPALTSVRTPIAEAGVQAIERLIQELESKKTEAEEDSEAGWMIEPRLIIRESCVAPRTVQ